MCFAAASVLSRNPLAGDAGFLVVMFVGMLVQACGPRALGCAMLGVVCFYLGLYLHPSSLHLVQSLLLSAFGPLMVTLVGRVIVPMRAAASFRLAIHTVTLRASRVLAAPGAVHLSALNEAALSLEEQLALLNPPDAETIRERIVEVEVAAGQHAFASAPAHGDAHASADVLRHAIVRLKEIAHQGHVAPRRFASVGWRYGCSIRRVMACRFAHQTLLAASHARHNGCLSRDADRPLAVSRTLVLGGHHDVRGVSRHAVTR